MAKGYSRAQVDTIREQLVAAPRHERDRKMTTREVVRELAEEIRMLLEERDYTVAALAEYLGKIEVTVSVPTLAQYVREEGVRSARRGGRGNRRAAGRRKKKAASGPVPQAPGGRAEAGPGEASGESGAGRPGDSEAASRASVSADGDEDAFAKADKYNLPLPDL